MSTGLTENTNWFCCPNSDQEDIRSVLLHHHRVAHQCAEKARPFSNTWGIGQGSGSNANPLCMPRQVARMAFLERGRATDDQGKVRATPRFATAYAGIHAGPRATLSLTFFQWDSEAAEDHARFRGCSVTGLATPLQTRRGWAAQKPADGIGRSFAATGGPSRADEFTERNTQIGPACTALAAGTGIDSISTSLHLNIPRPPALLAGLARMRL